MIDPLIKQIDDVLEQNGTVSPQTKDRLMFSVVKTILLCVQSMSIEMVSMKAVTTEHTEQLKELKEKNIVLWAKNHPKATLLILSMVAIILFERFGTVIQAAIGLK